jgi:hypothetical protein
MEIGPQVGTLLGTALVLTAAAAFAAGGKGDGAAVERILAGQFRWTVGEPLVAPVERPDDPCVSVKDPSIVFFEGRWHLFCTIRSEKRTHQIEYLSFADWDHANEAPRHVLTMHAASFCAPQVFWFAPHGKWYLICQASDESWEPKYGPAFATSEDIADPTSWSPLTLMGARQADGKTGLDFWIICDQAKACLFFTTLDGRMWREETALDDFPFGWSEPALAIQGHEGQVIRQHGQHTTDRRTLDRQHQPRRADSSGRGSDAGGGPRPPAVPLPGRAGQGPRGEAVWTDSLAAGDAGADDGERVRGRPLRGRKGGGDGADQGE